MIYILIPIYNEYLNIDKLFNNLNSTLQDKDKFYVFVDDGSTDNSTELLTSLFNTSDYIILGDGHNYGPGYSFNIGFEWIINHSKNSNDKIVTMEGDNTSDINILPKMITISELGYDLVLASPYAQGGGFDKTGFVRKITSLVANLILRYVFNIKVLTLSSFYRVYNIKLIQEIKRNFGNIIVEKGFISKVEILIKAIKLKASIIEVPMVLYSAQRVGKSKMKVFKTFLSYVKIIFVKFKFVNAN